MGGHRRRCVERWLTSPSCEAEAWHFVNDCGQDRGRQGALQRPWHVQASLHPHRTPLTTTKTFVTTAGKLLKNLIPPNVCAICSIMQPSRTPALSTPPRAPY